MRLKFIIFTLLCTLHTVGFTQTLEQARTMFSKGEYESAKPVFQRFVKSQPGNANYNYWYGVCCLKTNEAEESVKYLEFAHKRKVANAPLFLGQAYEQLYRFDEAVRVYEEHIAALAKKKQSTEAVLPLLESSKMGARMLKGVEMVCFIDSFVVDKDDFLSAYRISPESGSVYTYNEIFQTTGENTGTVYETELKNKLYYSEKGENGTLNILSRNKMLGEWGPSSLLPGSINQGANANYPFVSTDGITLYFASDGENSLGEYDIFITRYNTGSESYLTPENVGMPFNSPFNDYMYAIDEYNQLGWFATNRNQPEDKVCVYVFIPNRSKQTYNYESMEPQQIRQLALLHSIKDTWKDPAAVTAAKERLATVFAQRSNQKKKHDFEFIINDQITYYSLNDFTSQQSKGLFMKYQQLEKDYLQQRERLDNLRDRYAQASQENKKREAPAILDLEKRVQEMSLQLDDLAVQVRNQENRNIKK